MTLSREKTALLLIDFQVDFASPNGAMARKGHDLAGAQAAVLQAEVLAEAARRSGVAVIFVRLLDGGDGLCVQGTPGADFVGPQPVTGETVVSKRRYSAFTNTGLDEQLKARGVETVVLAGLTTDCCLASSAWDAFERDFRIVIAADACAAYEPDLHSQTLRALALSGATVMPAAEIERAWK